MQQAQTLTLTNTPAFENLRATNPLIYISGPITGIAQLNKPLFETAAAVVKSMKLNPVNPHDLIKEEELRDFKTPDEEWAYCMQKDISALTGCGGVLMLPDWQKSKGAVWEFLTAKTLQIPVFTPTTPDFFAPNPTNTPTFELLNLTEIEYIELFYNITNKIKGNDVYILNKFLPK